MHSFIQWLLTWCIPDGSIPSPMAGEYDEHEQQKDWKKRTHNQSLATLTSQARVLTLRQVDAKVKERYDEMDHHVVTLRGLKLKIREHKLAKRRTANRTQPKPKLP